MNMLRVKKYRYGQYAVILASFIVANGTIAGSVDMPITFSPGQILTADQINQNFSVTEAAVDGNATDIANKQERVSSPCSKGQAIREINADGTVQCESMVSGEGGDITAVATPTGSGLLGGADAGDVSLSLDTGVVQTEAISAMGAVADTNPLNHNKYTDTNAQSAMGTLLDTNPLNHDRYTDAEAQTANASKIGANTARISSNETDILNLTNQNSAVRQVVEKTVTQFKFAEAINLTEIQFVAPGDGFVILMASGNIHATTGEIMAIVSISDTSTAIDMDWSSYFSINRRSFAGEEGWVVININRVEPVVDGTSYTYYLTGELRSGQSPLRAVKSTFTAIFVPLSLGL